MKSYINLLLFPDKGSQEINHSLSINQMVDINGIPLQLPIPTHKMIAYRVFRISTKDTINDVFRCYHLEIIPAYELEEFVAT